MLQRKLGEKKAEMVLKAFAKEPKHFGFIKTNKEELAALTTPFSPSDMPLHQDVYTFRAGVWLVLIVTHEDWVDVTLLNPHDVNENYTVSAEKKSI